MARSKASPNHPRCSARETWGLRAATNGEFEPLPSTTRWAPALILGMRKGVAHRNGPEAAQEGAVLQRAGELQASGSAPSGQAEGTTLSIDGSTTFKFTAVACATVTVVCKLGQPVFQSSDNSLRDRACGPVVRPQVARQSPHIRILFHWHHRNLSRTMPTDGEAWMRLLGPHRGDDHAACLSVWLVGWLVGWLAGGWVGGW